MIDKHHKEELEQNDLQEFLANFGEWWSKHGTQTLLVILVAVGAFTGYNWWKGKELRAKEAAWAAITGAGGPESLERVAYEHDLPGASQMALLSAADQLQVEALGLTPFGQDAGPDPTSAELSEDTMAKLARARALYQQVIDYPDTSGRLSLLKANARLGLAAILTSTGEIDAAKQQYDYLRRNAGDYRGIGALADERYKALDELAQPIVFPPGPDPVESIGGSLELESGAADDSGDAENAAESGTDTPAEDPAPAETPAAP